MKTLHTAMLMALAMAAAPVIRPEFDATTKDPTKDVTFGKDDLLTGCKVWFDGCNSCSVRDGRIGRCGRKWCRRKKEAFCRVKVVTAAAIEEEKKDAAATYTTTGSMCGHPFKDRANVDKTALAKCKTYQGIDNCITYQLGAKEKFPPIIVSCKKTADCVYAKQSPACSATYTDDEVTTAATASRTLSVDYKKCLTWWDGCNECPVYAGTKQACATTHTCDVSGTAFCKIKVPIIPLKDQSADNNSGTTIFKETGTADDKCGKLKATNANILSPWPKNCEIYMGQNACDKYQMSPDGVKVISCYIADTCVATVLTPSCQKSYPVFDDTTKAAAEFTKVEYEGCKVWFDGCNKCAVNDDATLGTCGTQVCAINGSKFCAMKLPSVKSTNKVSYEFQKESLMSCKVWNNGCNDCQVKYGKITSCGKKQCLVQGTPSCTTAITATDLIKEDPAKFEDEDKMDNLQHCKTWFDGCNTCKVDDGKIMECTRRWCKNKNTATKGYCKEKIVLDSPLTGCTEWNDGCKTCNVDKEGAVGNTCTNDVSSCNVETKKVAYCKTFQSTFAKRVAGVAQQYLKGCESWFDGCNTCTVATDGKLTQCTKKYCEKNTKAFCKKKVGAAAIVKDAKQKKLEKCAQWFNGCNYCDVQEGKIGKCTQNKCTLFRRPFCKVPIDIKYKDDNIAIADCGTWFDGCNTCKVTAGKATDCTKVFCATPGKEFCQEKPNEIKKRAPIVPGGCEDFFDGCNTCPVKNGKKGTCTTKTCANPVTASCKKEVVKANCELWFTGCNFCHIDRKGIEICSKNVCVLSEKPFCVKKRAPFVDKYDGVYAKIDMDDPESMKKVYKLAPPPTAFKAKKSSMGKLSCSMDGLTKMVQEMFAIVLYGATFANETFKAMLPQNLQLALSYGYTFLLGAGDWLGYAMATLYFFSIEYDFGEYVCDAMGYGYEVIDLLNNLTQFSGSTDAQKAASAETDVSDWDSYKEEPAEEGQDWFEGVDDSDTTGEAVVTV